MKYEYKTSPMSHQRAALNKSHKHPAFAYFMEQGTGKTKVYLDEACWRYEAGEIDTLLIFSKNEVHQQIIEQEVPRHVPARVKHMANWYKAGNVNAAMWKSLQYTDRLVIIAFNIETLASKTTMKNVERCFFVEAAVGGRGARPTRPRKVMAVIDESHQIRTPAAKRTRNAWTVGKRSVIRRIGTGSEIGSGLENLYAQFRFLDVNIIGCPTYTAFKNQYCVLQGISATSKEGDEYQVNLIKGYKNVDELMRRIEPYVFVCEKKDCMDLPRQLFLDDPPRIVHLTPEQKRLMKDLKDNYVTELDSGEVVEAPLAISRLQKFQQIAGGHIQLGGKRWEPVPNGSLPAAVDIAEGARGQFIVWAQWVPDLIQLLEAFKKAGANVVSYHGENTNSQNSSNKSAFKEGKVDGFLSTFSKGAEGLDFPTVPTSIYYTLTFDPIAYWQSLSRNHRKGTLEDVTYHFLHRPGSPDAKLLRALKSKKAVADLLRDPAIFKQWLDAMLDEDPAHDEVIHPELPVPWNGVISEAQVKEAVRIIFES